MIRFRDPHGVFPLGFDGLGLLFSILRGFGHLFPVPVPFDPERRQLSIRSSEILEFDSALSWGFSGLNGVLAEFGKGVRLFLQLQRGNRCVPGDLGADVFAVAIPEWTHHTMGQCTRK